MADMEEEAWTEVAIRFVDITKKYPGVVANDHISFNVLRGEIHGLLGENGAGKTTLMKILYGLENPDEGYLVLNGERVDSHTPREALRRGIVMIQQHPSLIDRLSVEENILLELWGAGVRIKRDELRRRLTAISEEYGLRINPKAYGWQLSLGEKQRVEFAKAILLRTRILILDEPTTILSPIEVEALFRFIRKISSEGVTVLFITHRLGEALSICDRITVLRKGRVIGTVPAGKASPTMLVEMMFGSSPPTPQKTVHGSRGPPLLRIRDLWVRSDQGGWAVKGASITIHSGEIVGIVGISGNGQRELAEAVAGLRRPAKGSIEVEGRNYRGGYRPRIALDLGISYIPEDRLGIGVARGLTVAENAVLRDLWWNRFVRKGIIDWRTVRSHASLLVSKYGVKTPGIDTPIDALSGGNIQRLIVGRELERSPRILVAHNPTSGLDVSAASTIRGMLLSMAAQGTGIMLFSDDLEEVLSISSRVAVMYDGRLLGPLRREEADSRKLGYAMATGVL